MFYYIFWIIRSNILKLFYFVWYHVWLNIKSIKNKDYRKTYLFYKNLWNGLNSVQNIRFYLSTLNHIEKSNHSCSIIEFYLDNKGFMCDMLYNKLKTITTKVYKVLIYNKDNTYYTVGFINNGMWNLIYKKRVISCYDIYQCVDTLWKIEKKAFNNKPVKFFKVG